MVVPTGVVQRVSGDRTTTEILFTCTCCNSLLGCTLPSHPFFHAMAAGSGTSALPPALDRYCNPAVDDCASQLAIILTVVPTAVGVPQLLRAHLGPYLTHADGPVRCRAMALVAALLRSGGAAILGADTPTRTTVAETILQFAASRMSDGPRCGRR